MVETFRFYSINNEIPTCARARLTIQLNTAQYHYNDQFSTNLTIRSHFHWRVFCPVLDPNFPSSFSSQRLNATKPYQNSCVSLHLLKRSDIWTGWCVPCSDCTPTPGSSVRILFLNTLSEEPPNADHSLNHLLHWLCVVLSGLAFQLLQPGIEKSGPVGWPQKLNIIIYIYLYNIFEKNFTGRVGSSKATSTSVYAAE